MPVPSSEPSFESAMQSSAEHTEYVNRKRIDSMDGLRAIGILAVVHQHTMDGTGRLGANLFLMLSGYLVTTLLIRERTSTGTIDLTRFSQKRWLRLFPLYFTVLACYVALVWQFETDGTSRSQFFANLLAFATLTSNLFVHQGDRVIFFFSWTVAAQEQFHFIWSRLLKFAGTSIAFVGLASLLSLVYIVQLLQLAPIADTPNLLWVLFLSLKPTLLLGALLGLTLDDRFGYDLLKRFFGNRYLSLAFLVLVLFAWQFKAIPDGLMHFFLVSLVASCVVRESHILSRLLQHSILVFVGKVSYGIYLTHMLCHHLVTKLFRTIGIEVVSIHFMATFLLAIGVAYLSHRYFESLFLASKAIPKKSIRTERIIGPNQTRESHQDDSAIQKLEDYFAPARIN